MKRKLYSVEYVRNLEKIDSKVKLYRELNKSAEAKLMMIFKDFFNSNEDLANRFLEHTKTCVEDDSSFKAVIDELDKLGVELSQLVQPTQ